MQEITNAYKPAYQPVHKPAYIPVPQPAPVCHTVYAAPIAVCNKGKLSGQVRGVVPPALPGTAHSCTAQWAAAATCDQAGAPTLGC